MLTPARDYRMLCDTFRWEVPEYYNIAVDICDKWAHQPDRLALIYKSDNGQTRRYTFRDIQQFVKERLAAHEYPREIEFADSLPMTATGKIMRRELRDRQPH